MEIRHGLDMASVSRFKAAAQRQGMPFLKRLFTSSELRYCLDKKMKYEHLAARFAAKEAFMKAVGISRRQSLRFKEIEIRRRNNGKPYIFLSSSARRFFKISVKSQIELTMAHEREYAVAAVLIRIR